MTEETKPRVRRTLMDIAADVFRTLELNEGECDAALAALDVEIEGKVEAYKIVMLEFEQTKLAFEELARFYKLKAATVERKIDKLLGHLDQGMRVAGLDDIRARTAHAFYKRTTAIEIDSVAYGAAYPPSQCPSMWREKHEVSPNRAEIASLLADNIAVTGAVQVQNRHLQLR